MERILEGKKSYWLITIIGWTLFYIVMTGIMVLAGDPLGVGMKQLIIDMIFAIPIMVFASHFVRNRLNHHKIFQKISWQTVGVLIFYSVIAGLAAYGVSYLYYLVSYNLFGHHEALKNPIMSKPLLVGIAIMNTIIYVAGWAVLYVAIKGIMELNRSREEQLLMQTNMREMQLNNLKGQINPHFMFNSLNNIRGLMLEDVGRSREMITRLSEVLRYSLTKSNEDAIPLEEEMEMVEHYINISKIQLEERLQYKEEIEPDLLDIEIPPMLVQILVENAVKHGISTLPNGGELAVKINTQADFLTITVTNDGKLRPSNGDSTKVGLKNVRERLNLLYGEAADFSLTEQNNQVVATIKIPMK